MLVTGSVDQKVQIWDISNPETSEIKLLKTLVGHQAPVNAVAIAPDGQTIACGDNQNITSKFGILPENYCIVFPPITTLFGN
jgi:WD40 repeat protein